VGLDRPEQDAGEASWDLDEDWAVTVDLAEENGRLVVGGLRVYPKNRERLPQNGLTVRDLRKIRLEEATSDPKSLDSAHRMALTAALAHSHREREPEVYAVVALLYLKALRAAPGRPIAFMTEELNAEGMPVDVGQVRNLVHLARRHDFLTRGTRGSPGGEPTEKLASSETAARLFAKES
jgi:hypothetical protein